MFTDFLTSLPLSSAQPTSLKSQYRELVQDRYSDRSESGRGITPSVGVKLWSYPFLNFL